MKTLIHWKNWRRWKLEHEKMAQMAADIKSSNLQYFWKSLYEEATGRTEMTSPTLFCKKVTGSVALCYCFSSLFQRHWQSLLLGPRRYRRWSVLMNATHQPGVALSPWATLQRSPLMPSLTPTATWPLTSGKRLFIKFPYQEFTDHLVITHSRICLEACSSCDHHIKIFYTRKIVN